jgi:SMODS-associated and fused to various effectors sensor domain/TIR domain
MTAGVKPLGLVFLSYRVSDGRDHAENLAWALRAAGVPVWHDETDLPPGDTRQRLQEALASGLSGAVLVVTPEIAASAVVRDIEVPGLRMLAVDPAFSLAIASTVEDPARPGHLDFAAPDRLLGLPADSLRAFKQYPIPADIAAIARELARGRMRVQRDLGQRVLEINLQTRLAPQAEVSGSGLVVRTRPPADGRRAPPAAIWTPLGQFLRGLPQLAEVSAAERLLVRGGAHLSVAFALGAALPTTTRWHMGVEGSDHQLWDDALAAGVELQERLETRDAGDVPAAVLVDLVPVPAPVATFDEHVSHHAYRGILRVSQARPAPLPVAAGAGTADAISDRIRRAAATCGTNRVDLFLRVPFPMAVLLGRRLNTLEITLYEWEDGIAPPRYVPMATVAAGRGGGPIVNIHF